MTLPTSTTTSALAEPATVDKLVAELKSALIVHKKPKISCAPLGCGCLPLDDPHVKSDLAKIEKAQSSLVDHARQGRPHHRCAVQVGDGSHRFGASYHTEENTDIPQTRLTRTPGVEGNVRAAIDLGLDAARRAEESGQRAIEMLALHDAVRFGDHSSLGRLVDIATDVGGRLAAVIAAHAAALRVRDAAAILAAAHQLEVICALLSAAIRSRSTTRRGRIDPGR